MNNEFHTAEKSFENQLNFIYRGLEELEYCAKKGKMSKRQVDWATNIAMNQLNILLSRFTAHIKKIPHPVTKPVLPTAATKGASTNTQQYFRAAFNFSDLTCKCINDPEPPMATKPPLSTPNFFRTAFGAVKTAFSAKEYRRQFKEDLRKLGATEVKTESKTKNSFSVKQWKREFKNDILKNHSR